MNVKRQPRGDKRGGQFAPDPAADPPPGSGDLKLGEDKPADAEQTAGAGTYLWDLKFGGLVHDVAVTVEPCGDKWRWEADTGAERFSDDKLFTPRIFAVIAAREALEQRGYEWAPGAQPGFGWVEQGVPRAPGQAAAGSSLSSQRS